MYQYVKSVRSQCAADIRSIGSLLTIKRSAYTFFAIYFDKTKKQKTKKKCLLREENSRSYAQKVHALADSAIEIHDYI